jgi:2-oxoglutarate ferredoxin oxidoreductase subunit beta
MAHLIHTSRRNFNLTYLVQNNQVYGLTKGQTSPTSDQGFKTKSTPEGVLEMAARPLALALGAGATFLARGFAGDIMHLKGLIKQGIEHKGFALIDVLQPCVTFNKVNTYQWYQQRLNKLENEAGYDPTNRAMAFAKAEEWGDKINIGVYYKEQRPTYEEELSMLAKEPLVQQNIDNIDITDAMKFYQ